MSSIKFETFPHTRFPSQTGHLIGRLPYDLYKIMLRNCVIIAGGAITSIFSGKLISDYDLYCKTEEKYKALMEEIEQYTQQDQKNRKKVCETENAATYKFNDIMVQVIHTHLKRVTPQNPVLCADEILSEFDFTVCMAAYDVVASTYIINTYFFEHLANQKLVFNAATRYPISSLIRVKKYLKKGFSIAGIDLVKIALSVHNVQMESYQDLKDQLMGIDTAMFKDLTEDLIDNYGATAKLDYGAVMNSIENAMNQVFDLEKYEERGATASSDATVDTYTFDGELPFT